MAATKKTYREELDALYKHLEWWSGYEWANN